MPDMTESASSAEYDRGVADGRVAAKLAEFDNHFRKINGSVDRSAETQHQLTLAVERLIEQGRARDEAQVERDKMALAMAVALEKRGDRAWAPWQRSITVALALLSVASLLLAVLR